jgi:hypothetical protein
MGSAAQFQASWLAMMVLTGGRERSESQFPSLLSDAAFSLMSVKPRSKRRVSPLGASVCPAIQLLGPSVHLTRLARQTC